MRLSRLISRRWVTLLWLVLLAVALMMWSVQPWILSALLGFDEFQDDGRMAVLKLWGAGRLAPMTTVGLLSLFPVLDVLLAVVLLAAIFVLVIKLFERAPDSQRVSWLSANLPQSPVSRSRFRFWTVIGLIALLGLEYGWEVAEWKKWHHRERYLGLADGFASSSVQSRKRFRRIHAELTRLDEDGAAEPNDASATDAVSHQRYHFETHLVYTFALAKAFDERAKKYAEAAKHPLQPVRPDPPLPQKPSDSAPTAEGYSRDHGRILAVYNELVRSYPKDARAHQGRAWILATCPDGKYRDGMSAVKSATQACKLTNWQEVSALSTLAAAYAEAGDFPSAVLWEQKAGELSAAPRLGGKRKAERLALYQAGKPFRLSP